MSFKTTPIFRGPVVLAVALGAVVAGHLVTAQVARVDGYEAILANVEGLEGTPVRIDLVRWSSDDDRDDVIAALTGYTDNLAALDEWIAAREAEEVAAAAEAAANPPAEEAEGRGGRGGRGGGRGGGDADEPEPEPRPDPLGELRRDFNNLDTAGVLWADSSSGYLIKFAYNEALPDGGERVLLVTSTELGDHRFRGWPTAEGPEAYPYSVIEIRIPADGLGVGKTSLSTAVVLNAEANTIALDSWDAAPVHFDGVALTDN